MATDLKDLHLADLHERAAAAGIERLPPAAPRRADRAALGGGRGLGARRTPRRARPRPSEGARGTPSPTPRRDTDEVEVVEATVLDDPRRRAGRARPERRGGRRRARRGRGDATRSAGVLELTRQRYGFLRLSGLAPADGDVYVSAAQVRRCELRTGDEVSGPAREPRRGERHPALVHVDTVNGEEPTEEVRARTSTTSRRCCPSAGSRSSGAGDDVLAPRGRPARAARVRPAGAGPRRAALGADDAAALARTRRGHRGHGEGDRAARRRAPRGGDRLARGAAGRRVRDRDRRARARSSRCGRPSSRSSAPAAWPRPGSTRSWSATRSPGSRSPPATSPRPSALFGSGRNLSGGGSLTVIATTVDGSTATTARRRARRDHDRERARRPRPRARRGRGHARRSAPPSAGSPTRIRSASRPSSRRSRKLRAQLADLDAMEAAELLRERIEATQPATPSCSARSSSRD